jgi:TPR repeat protein
MRVTQYSFVFVLLFSNSIAFMSEGFFSIPQFFISHKILTQKKVYSRASNIQSNPHKQMQNNNNQKQKQQQDDAGPTSNAESTDHEETATSSSPPPPQVVYHSDVCSICQEDVSMLDTTTFRVHTCCGKVLHAVCLNDLRGSKLSNETKNSCPWCRGKNVDAGSKEEIRRLRKWSQKNKRWAQEMLAGRYREGIGVPQDDKRAFVLYKLAADQGYHTAQYNLGNMYATGHGVNRSATLAFKFYKLCAEQGDAQAQFNVGTYYANSTGVEQSFTEAREWWTKSAAQGYENAIKYLKQLDEMEGRTTTTSSTTVTDNIIVCFKCNKPQTNTHKLKHCGCKAAKYCNSTCQTKHWPEHKTEHRRIVKAKGLINTEGEMKDEVTTDDKKETATSSTSPPPQASMSTTTDDSKQFSVGTQWMIKALTSEIGKKFNGKTCVVVSIFDVTTGRVGVRIKNARNSGRTINIKPINLHDDQSTTQEEGLKETKPEEANNAEDCPQKAEDIEDCPICQDALPKLTHQFVHYTCCGKGLHIKCADDLVTNKSMTSKQKMKCILCRTKQVACGSKQEIGRLRGWVKKGKAWAMSILAQRYIQGVVVKQSDKKAIELLEMAAERGDATAQSMLGHFYRLGIHGLTQSSKTAIKYYTLAAEQGDACSQFYLGNNYANGDGIGQSNRKAIELYETAAKGGNANAQYQLGLFYKQGSHGLTQSSKKSIEYYALAAEQGDAGAQYNLGLMYATGDGIEQSYSKARELWTKAAAQGHENAITNLKIMNEQERVKTITTPPEVVDLNIISCSTCGKKQTKDFRLKKCQCRTKRYCNSQCQKKQYKQHKKECLRLVKERKKKKNGTNMKENGTKDGKKEKPIQEAEDKEDCPICTDALPKLSSQFVRYTCCGNGLHHKCAKDLDTNTSMTYEQKMTCIMCRTKVVATGSKEHIESLRKWIKKGKGWAMEMLAERYRDGVGVKQSDKKAIKLFEMAAKRGIAGAQFNLGLFYRQGRQGSFYIQGSHGFTQSDKRAIELYTLAAEQGHAKAQCNLGSMYANGEGIETSFSKAREWSTKAAAQGSENAIKNLRQLDELGL